MVWDLQLGLWLGQYLLRSHIIIIDLIMVIMEVIMEVITEVIMEDITVVITSNYVSGKCNLLISVIDYKKKVLDIRKELKCSGLPLVLTDSTK